MNRVIVRVLLLAVLVGFAALPALGEEESGEEGVHKKNHFSVIIGGTSVPRDDETVFTLGVDFERELTRRIGVGFVVEHAFGELDATSLFAVTDIHLGRGFVLQAGPGVEFLDDEAFAVGRLGLFYEFEVGEILLAPSLSYDISEIEDSIVFGLSAGIKF